MGESESALAMPSGEPSSPQPAAHVAESRCRRRRRGSTGAHPASLLAAYCRGQPHTLHLPSHAGDHARALAPALSTGICVGI